MVMSSQKTEGDVMPILGPSYDNDADFEDRFGYPPLRRTGSERPACRWFGAMHTATPVSACDGTCTICPRPISEAVNMDHTEQKNRAVLGAIRRATGRPAPAGKRRESVEARDVRLLTQSARALRKASEWLNECEQCGLDLHDSDELGVLIAAVDEALTEAEEARDHIRNAR